MKEEENKYQIIGEGNKLFESSIDRTDIMELLLNIALRTETFINELELNRSK